MLISLKKQSGLSLIEIMVSLTIGIFLIGTAASIGLTSSISGKEGIQQTNLQENLSSIMTEASRDLRRAGYSKNIELSSEFRKAYLSQKSTIDGKEAYQCIVFFYDNYNSTDSSAGDGIRGNEDSFGLTFKDGQVMVLVNGDKSTTTCSGDSADGWQALNSKLTGMPEITNFYFTIETTPTVTKNAAKEQIGGLAIGNITLYVEGKTFKNAADKSKDKANFENTLSQIVQIRNLPVIQ